MSWEELGSEARQLESDIDAKLVAFSKLGRDATRSSGSGAKEPLLSEDTEGTFTSMSLELQQLLSRLSGLNDSMEGVIGERPSASVQRTVQRHGALLNERQQEFTKTKRSIRDTLNKTELLSSVQSNISSFRTSEAKRQDMLMKENQHTLNSMRHADETISIAMAAKEALHKQRDMFSGVSSKMGDIAKKVPVLNNLMQKIQYRKNRDKVILGLVVSACSCFLIWYTLM